MALTQHYKIVLYSVMLINSIKTLYKNYLQNLPLRAQSLLLLPWLKDVERTYTHRSPPSRVLGPPMVRNWWSDKSLWPPGHMRRAVTGFPVRAVTRCCATGRGFSATQRVPEAGRRIHWAGSVSTTVECTRRRRGVNTPGNTTTAHDVRVITVWRV